MQRHWDPGQLGLQKREREESHRACRAGVWARSQRGSGCARQSYQMEKAPDVHSVGAPQGPVTLLEAPAHFCPRASLGQDLWLL